MKLSSSKIWQYKRVNIANLTAVLWKAHLQGWPLASVWELRFGEGSHHWRGSKLCKQCSLCGTPAFLWESGIWVWAWHGCLCDQPPIKTIGTESLMSFLGWQHFTCCHSSLLGELSISCVAPLGEDSWKLVPDVLWTLPGHNAHVHTHTHFHSLWTFSGYNTHTHIRARNSITFIQQAFSKDKLYERQQGNVWKLMRYPLSSRSWPSIWGNRKVNSNRQRPNETSKEGVLVRLYSGY